MSRKALRGRFHHQNDRTGTRSPGDLLMPHSVSGNPLPSPPGLPGTPPEAAKWSRPQVVFGRPVRHPATSRTPPAPTPMLVASDSAVRTRHTRHTRVDL
nr:hypothetical protein KitaXyl93_43400 [Kitasatospora sp. Xyl93]